MVDSLCKICSKEIRRAGNKPGKTCSRECASELRRQQRPITKDELVDLYVVQKMGTTQIGKLVGRDPKRVYEWLIDWGISTRDKWEGNIPEPKPFHNPDWLKKRYCEDKQHLYDIAVECNTTPGVVLRYMKKFKIDTRSSIESRIAQGQIVGLSGSKNGMFGRKGSKSPSWKGGCTPDRQLFYQSGEWKSVCSFVWKRDDATCKICNTKKTSEDQKYCIHHIVSFSVKELRAEVSNLVLLCDECHRWVHSKKNVSKQLIGDVK